MTLHLLSCFKLSITQFTDPVLHVLLIAGTNLTSHMYLVSTKPLSEPMLEYWYIVIQENAFENGSHFVLASMC